MHEIAKYQRRAFLKDHPPIMERKLIASSSTEATYLAGTVLGLKDEKYEPWTSASEAAECVLAEDIVVPAAGDAWGLVYTHAAIVASELLWAEGVSATDQKKALAELRAHGLYASEA